MFLPVPCADDDDDDDVKKTLIETILDLHQNRCVYYPRVTIHRKNDNNFEIYFLTPVA